MNNSPHDLRRPPRDYLHVGGPSQPRSDTSGYCPRLEVGPDVSSIDTACGHEGNVGKRRQETSDVARPSQ